MEINLLKSLPTSWKRKTSKVLKSRFSASIEDRILSWRLDKEYFDGTRAQGYAGYKYDGRWKPVAKDIIKHYKLKDDAKILDIGCAKGFLLDEFGKILKKPILCGLDISHYSITKANKKIKKKLCIGKANSLPFDDNFFDLVISINSLHNIMRYKELKESFKEMQRVSKKNIFITLGAYTSNKGKKTLDKWAVVATAYMSTKAWLKFFKHVGYKGDYWWYKPE